MRVAVLGTGIMGAPMARNLVAAGYAVTVHNRSPRELDGATAAGSPRAVAERSDVVITMVVDGPQVETLLLGDDGAVHDARDGTLFIDMSTIGPADARRIGGALADAGHRFVDAPVTGSAPKAQDGTLTIMAGGSDEDMARAMPLLEAMGELIVHVGPVGTGQQVKVLSNAVSAVNCATLAQALAVGRRADVNLEALLKVMGAGSANSTMLQLKGEPMLTHDFSPLFKLAHMLKDVRLCLDEARAAGAAFPAAALAGELYAAGAGRGLGEQDFAAVLEVVESLNDTRV